MSCRATRIYCSMCISISSSILGRLPTTIHKKSTMPAQAGRNKHKSACLHRQGSVQQCLPSGLKQIPIVHSTSITLDGETAGPEHILPATHLRKSYRQRVRLQLVVIVQTRMPILPLILRLISNFYSCSRKRRCTVSRLVMDGSIGLGRRRMHRNGVIRLD